MIMNIRLVRVLLLHVALRIVLALLYCGTASVCIENVHGGQVLNRDRHWQLLLRCMESFSHLDFSASSDPKNTTSLGLLILISL